MLTNRLEAAKVGELAEGEMKSLDFGDRTVVLLNVAGDLYAIDGECTHQGCALSEGFLEEDVLECSCHGSMFNVKTGEVVQGPAEDPVPGYSVEIDGATVYVGTK